MNGIKRILQNEYIRFILILLIILLCGLFLRVYKLSSFGFWWDELYHITAAKSLITDGTPFIPMQGDYTRAYPFTVIVSWFIKLFGVNEVAGRLPAVIFNMLFILLGSGIVARLFNRRIALVFALVMSFSPFEIDLSRMCRMYTMFQLLFFLGWYYFYVGFERITAKRTILPAFEKRWNINIIYCVFAGALLLISAIIHELTFTFVFVPLVYSLILAIYYGMHKKGFMNKYALVCAAIILAFIGVWLIDKNILLSKWQLARVPPSWESLTKSNFVFYRYFLSDNYPVFFFLYPLSAILLIMKEKKKGLYVVLSFVVLLLMHFFVFTGRQLDRYILYIFPLFILGSSYLLDVIILAVWRAMKRTLKERHFVITCGAAICALIALNTFGYPWLANARKAPNTFYWNEWSGVPYMLKDTVKKGTVITTRQMAYMYYFNALPNAYMRVDPEDAIVEHPKYPIAYIDSVDTLQQYFEKVKGPLYIVTTPWTFNNNVIVSAPMREFIFSRCERFDDNKNKHIIVYRRKDAVS